MNDDNFLVRITMGEPV